MPTYDYECKDCGKELEIFHRFDDSPPPCDKCKSDNLEIVIKQAPSAFIKGEPTTLGQLSESNTKHMGRYELEDKRAYQNAEKKEKKKDWWETAGDSTPKEINKMTEKQKTKYIRGD